MSQGSRRYSPASERNRQPILAELQRVLPRSGLLLEIASGTGQHAAWCAERLPGWRWLPTDFEADALPSINAWCEGMSGVLPPLQLDVLQPLWHGVPDEVQVVFCANMIHIAPWPCTPALLHGAARHLSPQGLLVTYGPYLEDRVQTSPGNLAFDADLKARNPAWGLRRREEVEEVALKAGLVLRERVSMPSNNLLLVWARAGARL